MEMKRVHGFVARIKKQYRHFIRRRTKLTLLLNPLKSGGGDAPSYSIHQSFRSSFMNGPIWELGPRLLLKPFFNDIILLWLILLHY